MKDLKQIKHPSTFEEFQVWFNKFFESHGGYAPSLLKRWHDQVEKNHESLRSLLGDVRKQGIYKLKSQQQPVPMDQAGPLIDQILTIATGYLDQYGFTRETLLYPTIQQGSLSGFRVAKHIRTHAEHLYRITADRGHAKLKELEKPLSQLGELWSRSRTSDIELEATISTAPRSFALLGHYGPDPDSCFRNGSDKTCEKFIVGQTENTFTISISHKSPKTGNWKNIARCFGYTANNHNTFHIINPYIQPGFMEGDVIEVIKQIVEGLWKDSSTFHEDKVQIPEGTVYHNPYGRWSFTKGANTNCDFGYFTPDTHLIKTFYCQKCDRDSGRETGWTEIDGTYECPYCVKRANKCQMSGKLTFKKLESAIDEDGNLLEVHPDIAEKMIKCSDCGIAHSNSNNIQGKNICTDCLESQYSECEFCYHIVADSDLTPIGTIDCCNKCYQSGILPFDEDDIEAIIEHQENDETLESQPARHIGGIAG